MAPKKKVIKKASKKASSSKKREPLTFEKVRDAVLADLTEQVLFCKNMDDLDEFTVYALGKTLKMVQRFDKQEGLYDEF